MLVCSIQFCLTRSYPIVSCSYPGSILTGVGGDEGIRTPGLRLAKAALSQLSYIPKAKIAFGGPLVPRVFAGSTPAGCQASLNCRLVGLPGFEPGTFPLSEERSNQLS